MDRIFVYICKVYLYISKISGEHLQDHWSCGCALYGCGSARVKVNLHNELEVKYYVLINIM